MSSSVTTRRCTRQHLPDPIFSNATRNAGRLSLRRSDASLKLVELCNDDGHVCGWVSLGEAVAMSLANLLESAR
jgi:hypothetical protein